MGAMSQFVNVSCVACSKVHHCVFRFRYIIGMLGLCLMMAFTLLPLISMHDEATLHQLCVAVGELYAMAGDWSHSEEVHRNLLEKMNQPAMDGLYDKEDKAIIEACVVACKMAQGNDGQVRGLCVAGHF